ncbi:hypothetical protein HerbRD11066_34820 [Herbidospora sp. RD11066]
MREGVSVSPAVVSAGSPPQAASRPSTVPMISIRLSRPMEMPAPLPNVRAGVTSGANVARIGLDRAAKSDIS